jgi:hypothetical protein
MVFGCDGIINVLERAVKGVTSLSQLIGLHRCEVARRVLGMRVFEFAAAFAEGPLEEVRAQDR